jgi:drug/metabolite transporter (DMT)-like permease
LLDRSDSARRGPAWRTHLALVVVQVAFAGGAVEGKLAMRPAGAGGGGVEPIALAMARILGAAIFFQIVARAGSAKIHLPWRDHARIAGLAMLGIVLNQTLFLVGLRLTTAFAAALLGATIPVFTAALAVAFRVERTGARTVMGLALALGGVLWLTGIGTVDVGAIVIAVNCMSYALYIVLSRSIVRRLGALTFITWIFAWGAVLLAPLGAWPLAHGMATWGARGWELAGFMVAVPTIVAYFANAWALGRSTPTLVTVYIYLQPLLAAALQWVQLGEPVARTALVAAAFILAGVTLVATRRLAADRSAASAAQRAGEAG